MLYIVKDSDLSIKNKHYTIGEKVGLSENQIQGIEQFLEPAESKITLDIDNTVKPPKKSNRKSRKTKKKKLKGN